MRPLVGPKVREFMLRCINKVDFILNFDLNLKYNLYILLLRGPVWSWGRGCGSSGSASDYGLRDHEFEPLLGSGLSLSTFQLYI